MKPFIYWRSDRAIAMSYDRLPDEVFAHVEILAKWLDISLEIAYSKRKKAKC